MEVQCFEMWSKVKIWKAAKLPKFGKNALKKKIHVDERISQCLYGCYAF